MRIAAFQNTVERVRRYWGRGAEAPLTTEQVLREEAKAIHGAGAAGVSALSGKDLNRALNKLEPAALCLSGGGIRSASFALGVIQALATHPRADGVGPGAQEPEGCFLAHIHYLSTVSGGGYIGSWLSAWVTRAGFAEVWRKLTGRRDRPEDEPQEISWLRSYSNYLTPKLGLGSADTWAALVLVLRNLLLNWLVILPALCAVIILLKILAIGMAWIGRYSPNSCFVRSGSYDPTIIFGAIGFVFLIFALRFRTRNRPTRGVSLATHATFLVYDLLPTTIASFLFVVALAPACIHDAVDLTPIPLFGLWPSLVSTGAVVGAAVYLVSWLAAWPQFRNAIDYYGDLAAWIIAGALYGALLGVGVYFAHQIYVANLVFSEPSDITLIVFGVPWILLAQLLADMIFVGLTSYEHGSDSDREWLARAAGQFMLAGLLWLIVMALVFVGSIWTQHLWDKFSTLIAPAGGISGVIVAALGKIKLGAPAEAKSSKQPSYKKLISDAVFALAAVVFAVFLVILSSALLDQALFQETFLKVAAFGNKVSQDGYAPIPTEAVPLLWGFLIAAAIAAAASYWVNINRFSLHALYRNRLIRAFLGASHVEQRKPNPFTDFDELDNIPVWQLWPLKDNGNWPAVSGKNWQPYHLVNIALNIVSTKKLAWQERKAEAFVVSPLHSGTACGKSPDEKGEPAYRGAYRRSDEYGDPRGISLGTALAISGAAASPNMGYHSSPSLAFLLTMFNVRLGWWLGNPSNKNAKIYGGEGPRMALVPLLNEMIGNTTDDSTYVYLSDGGHFENLGLYEMVRRRCRYIVVSDAGCDPAYAFEDLGNAVRKIYLDLGVNIQFFGLTELKPRPSGDAEKCQQNAAAGGPQGGTEGPYYAIGVIDYPAADGGGKQGIILYVKAGYHADQIKNVGVRNYAIAHPEFPHESTGDQFFSESQFESYRALGFEIMDTILSRGTPSVPDPTHPTLPGIMTALCEKAENDGRP